VRKAGPLYSTIISRLDERSVRDILTKLAVNNPAAQSETKRAYFKLAEKHNRARTSAASSRAIDFDRHGKEAWHVLNKSKYTKLSSSKQYEFAADAGREVRGCIKAIDEGTKVDSPFETKLSTLATVRKIIKTILLADDTLGDEVRKGLQWDDDILTIMFRILNTMTEEERKQAGQSRDEKALSSRRSRRWPTAQLRVCWQDLVGWKGLGTPRKQIWD
jgi:hypothetical protein